MKKIFLTLPFNFAVLFCCLFSSSVFAIEVNDDVSINGFISQSWLKSPDNAYAGEDSLNGSFKQRAAGINAQWRISDRVNVKGQIVHRQQLEAANDTELDFLFIDYDVYAKNQHNLGVRLGRVKNQFGLYNSLRDIPTAHPGITVPNGYFISLRDLMLSTDGIEVYGQKNLDIGSINYSLIAGERKFNSDKLEEYFFQEDLTPDFKHSSNLGFDVNINFELIPGLKLGFSVLQLKSELGNEASYNAAATSFSTRLQDHIAANEFTITNRNLYAQYNLKNWIFSAEYIRNTTDSKNRFVYPINPFTGAFGTYGYNFISMSTIDDYYLQAEYFANKYSLMARVEKLDFVNPKTTTYLQTKGVTVGARWFFDSNWTLAAEMSSVNGILWLPVYPEIDYEKMRDNWKLYQLQLTYQF